MKYSGFRREHACAVVSTLARALGVSPGCGLAALAMALDSVPADGPDAPSEKRVVDYLLRASAGSLSAEDLRRAVRNYCRCERSTAEGARSCG